MDMDQAKKNEKMGEYIGYSIIIVIILIGIGVIATYAFLNIDTTKSSTTGAASVNADCLAVNVSEDILKLSINYPITDTYAKSNVTPIKVTITNACTTGVALNYTLALTSLTSKTIDSQNNYTGHIQDNKLRLYVYKTVNSSISYSTTVKNNSYLSDVDVLSAKYLNSELATKFGSSYNIKTHRKLDSDTISPGASKTYNVQLWVDYYEGDKTMYTDSSATHDTSYDNSTQGLKYSGVLSVSVNDKIS